MIILSPTDCTDGHRFSIRTIGYHRTLKRQTNLSSPLQGEIEGVGNFPHTDLTDLTDLSLQHLYKNI